MLLITFGRIYQGSGIIRGSFNAESATQLAVLLRAIVAPVILIATVVLSYGAALGISRRSWSTDVEAVSCTPGAITARRPKSDRAVSKGTNTMSSPVSATMLAPPAMASNA